MFKGPALRVPLSSPPAALRFPWNFWPANLKLLAWIWKSFRPFTVTRARPPLPSVTLRLPLGAAPVPAMVPCTYKPVNPFSPDSPATPASPATGPRTRRS